MKIWIRLGVLVCIASNAGVAIAAERHGSRFDISCSFGSTGCSVSARIFKAWWNGDESLQPIRDESLFALSCRGELMSASAGEVVRASLEDGAHWKIQGKIQGRLNATGLPAIDLGSQPFDGRPNPKSVNAVLEFPNGGSDSGTCLIALSPAF